VKDPQCFFMTFKWNSTFLKIFIDERGHHRKGVAIYSAT
jgi:hypothetical protein